MASTVSPDLPLYGGYSRFELELEVRPAPALALIPLR
jgi:hypothetical protein